MPEGHVIHGVAATLVELFGGQPVRVSSPQGRFAAGAELLDNCRFVDAYAHGKHLFASFVPTAGEPHWLHIHLGLYGDWSFATASGPFHHAMAAPLDARSMQNADAVGEGYLFAVPEPRGAVRLRLLNERAVADLNGPSTCEVLTDAEVRIVRARLGPDPLRDDASPAAFVRAAHASWRALGELLMDQRVIAGIGNIYRVELLFRHGVHPAMPGQLVSAERLQAIWEDAARLMADGARTGMIITTEPGDRPTIQPPAAWTRFAERAPANEADIRWYVYRRTGRPCHRCGAPIATTTMATRNVFWCPECQRAPGAQRANE